MSNLTKYYEQNHIENPYQMSLVKDSSRVQFLKYYITQAATPGSRILDVGCGDGFLHTLLPKYTWTGLDVSKAFSGGLNTIIKHDIESFPYPVKEGFDVAICSETLEHVFDPLPITKEIYRLLKPGGTYIVSTPNMDFVDHYISNFREIGYAINKPWTKEHIHWYTIQAHADLLGTAGFKGYEVMGADPHFGEFFKDARDVLFSWLKQNFDSTDDELKINTDMLISNMFKRHLHTIMLVTKK